MNRLQHIIISPLKKYRRLSVEKKSVIWYTIRNVMQKGISFLTIPIITRLLTTDEYGIYSVFLSWRDIIIIFATLNLFCGVYTKILVDHKDTESECTSAIQWLGTTISLIYLLVYFCFREPINNLLGYDTPTMLMLFGYYIFYPAFSLWCTKQRIDNNYILMVIVTIIVSVFIPLLSICLILFTSLRQYGPIWGTLIVYIVFGSFFFILNTYKGKVIYDKLIWRYAIKYNVPLIPHYLSMIVLGQSDRLMIKYFEDDSKAGIYSLAYQISSMMNIVFNAINSAFVPRAYRLMKEKKTDVLNNESMKLAIGALLISSLGIIIAPECVLIMGGKNYNEAIYVIPAVCMAVFVRFVYSFFCNYEFYFSKTRNIMMASAIAAVINIVLNWIFIPIFGYFAAGYTTLVGYLFLFVFHYLFAQKISTDNFGKKAYNNKSILFIVLITCILSVILPVLYLFIIIRYTLIILFAIFCFIRRKSIIALFKSVG